MGSQVYKKEKRDRLKFRVKGIAKWDLRLIGLKKERNKDKDKVLVKGVAIWNLSLTEMNKNKDKSFG